MESGEGSGQRGRGQVRLDSGQIDVVECREEGGQRGNGPPGTLSYIKNVTSEFWGIK